MEKALQESIVEYLSAHRYLALASVDPDGRPVVHTMGYASDGAIVYCATNRETRKAQNMKRNPNVAYVVSEDYERWETIQGVQIQGKATILEDQAEIKRAIEILARKFPPFASLGQNPVYLFFKIEPIEGYFLDYTKAFGHRDRVIY